MKTNTTLITEPMVLKLGNSDSLISIDGTCEALLELEKCQNIADMERALAGLKEYYDVTLSELPMLVDYEAENKEKLRDTFWVLNNVKKILMGIKIFRV